MKEFVAVIYMRHLSYVQESDEAAREFVKLTLL
jgi:hypothetical protein